VNKNENRKNLFCANHVTTKNEDSWIKMIDDDDNNMNLIEAEQN